LTEHVAKRALRHAAAEMRAKRPEHAADILDRVLGDRDAANDDDAALVLDFVEHPLKIGVERRMAAIGRHDVGKLGLAHPVQHVFERGGMVAGEVKGNVVLGEVAAAPDHLVSGRDGVDGGHGSLRRGCADCRAKSKQLHFLVIPGLDPRICSADGKGRVSTPPCAVSRARCRLAFRRS
jgi:hypothetical protein